MNLPSTHNTHHRVGFFGFYAFFLLINKFDFLSNSIYANYTARHLILKAAAVAQREKALFFEIIWLKLTVKLFSRRAPARHNLRSIKFANLFVAQKLRTEGE